MEGVGEEITIVIGADSKRGYSCYYYVRSFWEELEVTGELILSELAADEPLDWLLSKSLFSISQPSFLSMFSKETFFQAEE